MQTTGNYVSKSNKPGVVEIYHKVTFGSAAISSQDAARNGLTFTRTGTGTYNVVLGNKMMELLECTVTWLHSSHQNLTPTFTDAVCTNGEIDLILDNAMAATGEDPADGAVGRFKFVFRNTLI